MIRMLFDPAQGFVVCPLNFVTGQKGMLRLQNVVGFCQHHIRSSQEFCVDLPDNGKKLHRRWLPCGSDTKRIVGLFQKVKYQIIDLCRHIRHDGLVVILVADFGGKHLDGQLQIVLPIHPDDKIGHSDVIAEMNHTGAHFPSAAHRGDVLADVVIFVPEFHLVPAFRLQEDLIALLFKEQRLHTVLGADSPPKGLQGHRFRIPSQLDFKGIVTGNL